MHEKQFNICGTCIHRTCDGKCHNPKLDEYWGQSADESIDMLLYDCGGFVVGEFFGCIHHKLKD